MLELEQVWRETPAGGALLLQAWMPAYFSEAQAECVTQMLRLDPKDLRATLADAMAPGSRCDRLTASSNRLTTAADMLAKGVRAAAQATALSPETLDACKRAARALTAYLGTCGESALSYPQVNLIRAMHLAEAATGRPLRNANQVMGAVAPFFTPMQIEFAVELLTESLESEAGEVCAILD